MNLYKSPTLKSIILLSSKSSGSSAVQNFLTSYDHIRAAENTGHFENETLYWTKAASILGMPQMKLLGSIVPIEKTRARKELVSLVEILDTSSDNDEELIFNGWKRLCERYGPFFFEKSPHHLFQISALQLIKKCIERLGSSVDFLVVGLVRNPMDVLYSYWRRYKIDPVLMEPQLMVAYKNLQYCEKLFDGRYCVLHYENLYFNNTEIEKVLNFCEIDRSVDRRKHFDNEAIDKWRKDSLFNFRLSGDTIELALQLGYSKEMLT